MKIKPYKGCWFVSFLMFACGLFLLLCQLVGQKELPGVTTPSSYLGYAGGLWRGDEGMSINDTLPGVYAMLVLGLLLPYTLMGVGLGFYIMGHRRKKRDERRLEFL